MRITVESDQIMIAAANIGVARSVSVDSSGDDGSASVSTVGGGSKTAPLRLSSVASQRQQLLQRIDQLNEKWQHDHQFA